MADFDRRTVTGMRAETYAVDEGLRAFMLRVYNYMGAGLAITGVAAFGIAALATTEDPGATVAHLRNGVALTKFGSTIYSSPLQFVIIFAPLVAVFLLWARVNTMSVRAAQMTFWIYAALVGVSLSSIFLVYTSGSITRVFFITAATFGSLSLYGYTTRKDLAGWGPFLFMGLVGIFIACIVNLFLHAPALQWAISIVGVLVFSGLTAYDTQTIKEIYISGDSDVAAGRKAIIGALRLYLDFLNLFLMLLQLLGNNRN